MLGRKSVFFQEAFDGHYVGAGWLEDLDLTDKFPENWREFNKKYIPIYQKKNPDKTKVAAGLACGMLWTIARGMLVGDIVLCTDGQGSYLVGSNEPNTPQLSGSYRHS